MEVADSAVLSAMERTLLNPHVLEKAVARAVERLMSPPRDAVIDIDHQLRVVEQELDRLTHAIAKAARPSRWSWRFGTASCVGANCLSARR
jgi:hypothetical protein